MDEKKRRERRFIHPGKAVDRCDGLGLGEVLFERLGLCKRGLAALDGVDNVVLDGLDVLFRERAVERVDLRRADARALALTQELDALRRAVRALVELAGQRLDSKDGGSAARVDLPARQVELRLGENGICGIGKEGLVDALNVVAVPDAHAFETLEVQKRAAVGKKARALGRKAGLFFNTDAIDHLLSLLLRGEGSAANVAAAVFVGKIDLGR